MTGRTAHRHSRPTTAFILFSFFLGTSALAAALDATGQPSSDQLAEKIKRVETGLLKSLKIKGRPAEKMTLADRMAFYKVPAVSIAVIKDSRIEWAKAYGLRDVEAKWPTIPETLFQAASISKPVAATAVLRFVEKGLLDLNEDVNVKLVSWKVPENDFTAKSKVTLREILSHSAGLTVHGFAGYAMGSLIPTLRQVLDGEKPANSPPIRVDIVPGSEWRYAGGGYTVMQQLLVDVLKKPFPEIMKEAVLGPAGMSLSTYEQPLPPERLAESAVGYRRNGTAVDGRRHVYPEMAAAGLWTTPSDLCRLAIEIMKAYNGHSASVLSSAMAKRMLTMEKAPSGLGFILSGKDESFQFGHNGGNEGFRCALVAYPAKGTGAAIMTNSDAGDALYNEILYSLGTEYGMPGAEPVEKSIVQVKPEILDEYAGKYKISQGTVEMNVLIVKQGDHLLANLIGSGNAELYPETDSRFFTMDLAYTLVFERDTQGKIAGFLANGGIRGVKTASPTDLPKVMVIGTGGTISAGLDPMTNQEKSLTVSDLVQLVPALKDKVLIEVEDFVRIGSSSMTPDIQFRLAARVNEVCRARPDLSGIVITHGTDSLEETAYLVDLLYDDARPVVFAAAQRPPRVPDSDGPRNLENAIRAAISPKSRGNGALVVLNEDIHSARYVTKTHSIAVESFRSGKKGMLGTIDDGKVIYYNAPLNRLKIETQKIDPAVDLVRLVAGDSGKYILHSTATKASGIVIEAFGRGNMPPPVVDAVLAARKAGVIVVVVTRTQEGRVEMPGNWIKAGIIEGEDLGGLKARVLLMLALGATRDPAKIQQWFRLAAGTASEN